MLLWYVLAAQLAVAAFTLVLGLVSIGIGRRVRGAHPLHAAGWWVAGIAFTVGGAVAVVGGTGAAIAVIAGPESAFYALYLRWATVLNQSRTGIETAMGVVLFAFAVRRDAWDRVWNAAPWVLGAGFLAGVVAGLPVLEFDASTYAGLAIGNGVEFTVLAAALVAALVRSSIDWMLWVVVLVRTVSQAINMMILATMMWFRVEDAWFVSSQVLQTYLMVVVMTMLGVALWRLARARRGEAVPALLDRFRALEDRSMALPRRRAI